MSPASDRLSSDQNLLGAGFRDIGICLHCRALKTSNSCLACSSAPTLIALAAACEFSGFSNSCLVRSSARILFVLSAVFTGFGCHSLVCFHSFWSSRSGPL